MLRSLSISGRAGAPPPPAPLRLGGGVCEGAGEGLGVSPPHTASGTPVIVDQALTSAPNSPSSSYAEGESIGPPASLEYQQKRKKKLLFFSSPSARSRIDAMFANVDNNNNNCLHRGLLGGRSESPPALFGTAGASEIEISTSTFRRRGRTQQQQQQQQRTAGINPMRGSMFQLNTLATTPATSSLDLESRYGYATKQTPMTPGPGRRAPVSWLTP